MIADGGYDSQRLRERIVEMGATPVIPPRSNRTEPLQSDEYLYGERHLVECYINKMKHYRHIFSRFDKLAKMYLGFLHFVGTLMWAEMKCQHTLYQFTLLMTQKRWRECHEIATPRPQRNHPRDAPTGLRLKAQLRILQESGPTTQIDTLELN